MVQLRPYQIELIDAIRSAIKRGVRRIIAQCATGGGKTVVASHILAGVDKAGKHGLFLLPRRELTFQSERKLIAVHVYPGIIMAGSRGDLTKRIQLASFDTLHSRAVKRKKIEFPPADFVIVDECHLSAADTRRHIIAQYPNAILIGLTATPAGTNGRCLGDLYDELILSWPTQRMVDEGYLVDARYFAPSEPDWKKLKVSKKTGDYSDKSAGAEMSKPKLVGEVVDNWLRIASDRRTIVFCVTREHARFVLEEFKKHGIKTDYVDLHTRRTERKKIFERLENGETQVLVNVFIATFGLDVPPVSCVVIARPTRSLVVYHQMGGRGLRPVYADGMPLDTADDRLMAIACSMKPDCIVIDHSGVVLRHGRLTDPVPWQLKYDGTISEVKRAEQEKSEAPKEIKCSQCGYVFIMSHFCPQCGAEIIERGKPYPTYSANLEEVLPRDGNRANQKTPMDEKREFFAQALGYAQRKGFKNVESFARSKYLAKFGVKAPREMSSVEPTGRSEIITGWIKHEGIKNRMRNRSYG